MKEILEEIVCRYSLKVQFMDYKLWLHTLGKIIIINGPSSSGKTTLCKSLKEYGYNTLDYDRERYLLTVKNIPDSLILDLEKVCTIDTEKMIILMACHFNIWKNYIKSPYSPNYIDELKESLLEKIDTVRDMIFKEKFKCLFDKAIPLIYSGQNICLDVILFNQDDLKTLISCFNQYPNIYHTILYNPLERLLTHCEERNLLSLESNDVNFRMPIRILEQYEKFYDFSDYKPLQKIGIKTLDYLTKDRFELILKKAIKLQDRLEHNLETDIHLSSNSSIITNKIFKTSFNKYVSNSIKSDHFIDVLSDSTEEIIEAFNDITLAGSVIHEFY